MICSKTIIIRSYGIALFIFAELELVTKNLSLHCKNKHEIIVFDVQAALFSLALSTVNDKCNLKWIALSFFFCILAPARLLSIFLLSTLLLLLLTLRTLISSSCAIKSIELLRFSSVLSACEIARVDPLFCVLPFHE